MNVIITTEGIRSSLFGGMLYMNKRGESESETSERHRVLPVHAFFALPPRATSPPYISSSRVLPRQRKNERNIDILRSIDTIINENGY